MVMGVVRLMRAKKKLKRKSGKNMKKEVRKKGEECIIQGYILCILTIFPPL